MGKCRHRSPLHLHVLRVTTQTGACNIKSTSSPVVLVGLPRMRIHQTLKHIILKAHCSSRAKTVSEVCGGFNRTQDGLSIHFLWKLQSFG